MSVNELRQRTVAVVSGPVSEEDALYIREGQYEESSLKALLDCLSRAGVPHQHVDPTAPDFVTVVSGCDVALLNVHGPYGEDGRVQGLLDYLGVPYVNSGVMASAVGMDKLISKAVFSFLDIPTPAASMVGSSSSVPPPVPFMLKASDGGSSIGIEMVTEWADVTAAYAAIRQRGFNRIFAEAFVAGSSVTVGVIEKDEKPYVLPALETLSTRPFYDEAAKLRGGASGETVCREPQGIGREALEAMRAYSEQVYTFLECRGAIRVDFMVDAADQPYALEINTAPGLQPHSNLPVAALRAGISYDELILGLLDAAVRRGNALPWGCVAP